MTTVGQRIKTFRTAGDITQAELAGKLGVSIQTVSKWECDTGMPDIIQIVPLARVLEVTTDAILGADGDEQGYVDGVINSFREKWAGRSTSRYDMERYFDMFSTLKDILRRYPMNYDVAMECVYRGSHLLRRTVHDHLEVPEGCSVTDVYRDIKRMARSVIDYDSDLGRKSEAKKELIFCHYIMGNNEEAEAEYEGLSREDEYDARVWASEILDDREKGIDAARKNFSLSLWRFLNGIWKLADAYSVCGRERREEAKEIIKKQVEILEHLEGFMNEDDRFKMMRLDTIHLAKQYLRDGDFEEVINIAEKVTELCEKHFKVTKENPGDAKYFDSSVFESGIELGRWDDDYATNLVWLYDECADREENPVVTDPRFKACKARLEMLK